jgi:hypothetical protein
MLVKLMRGGFVLDLVRRRVVRRDSMHRKGFMHRPADKVGRLRFLSALMSSAVSCVYTAERKLCFLVSGAILVGTEVDRYELSVVKSRETSCPKLDPGSS